MVRGIFGKLLGVAERHECGAPARAPPSTAAGCRHAHWRGHEAEAKQAFTPYSNIFRE